MINAITLETVSEALSQLSRLGFEDVDIVQIFAAHGKAAGSSHLMMGQNPVFIISGEMRETGLPFITDKTINTKGYQTLKEGSEQR